MLILSYFYYLHNCTLFLFNYYLFSHYYYRIKVKLKVILKLTLLSNKYYLTNTNLLLPSGLGSSRDEPSLTITT